MKGDDLFQADEAVDFPQRRVPSLRRADVVSRGEQVTRVDAHREAFRLLRAIVDGSEMLDAIPKATPLTGGIFERDADLGFRRRGKGIVQPGDRAPNTDFLAGTHVRAR